MKLFSRCGAIFLALCVLIAFLPLSASAATYDIFTYEIKDKQVTITKCAKNTTGKVVVPETIEGYPVTVIGKNAFKNQSGITEIILPDSVTKIDECAFYGCSGMTTIQLSAKLSSIQYLAFYHCDSLVSLHFPASLAILNGSSFYCCSSNLAYLTVDEGNPHFYSVDNCIIQRSNKTLVLGTAKSKIPSDGSVTTIGTDAFTALSDLTHLTIPHGVTKVQSNAIRECPNLVSIHLSDTVTKYVYQTNLKQLSTLTVDPGNPVYHSSGNAIIETATKTLIQGCKNTKIPVDGSVTAIGSNAFRNCTGITAITIPEGVTTISASAFSACTNLASISLPSTLQSVGKEAFVSTALTEITFPASVDHIYGRCTAYASRLKSVTILNPDAQIDGGTDTFNGDITIYGYTGSTAESYAREHGKTFVPLDPHICTYDQKATADKYLSSAASCTEPASYFYSCTCGETGSKTFPHGDALPHTYDNNCDTDCNVCKASRTVTHTYDDWKSNEGVHWQECVCGEKTGEAAHTWDTGTVTIEPTAENAGTKLFTCTICSAQRTESVEPIPEVTEPNVPTEPTPTEPTPTKSTPTETTPPDISEPEDQKPSLIWILTVSLVVIGLIILIIILLRRRKKEKA